MSPRITGRYVLICCIAMLLSFVLHELAHWVAGQALGNDMALRLNSVYPVSGEYAQPQHYTMVSAAGPLFTLLQAILFWLILRQVDRPALYPFLLTPLYMRMLATVMSLMNPNDEARISNELGLGTFTLPIIVCCFLFYIIADVNMRRHWRARFTWLTLALIVASSSMLILADQFLRIRLL